MWTEPHHDANVWFLTHDEKCLWAACPGGGTPNNNKSVKILRHNEYAQRQVQWFFSTHSHTTTTVWKKKRIHKQIFWMSTWFASIILFLLFYHIILWLLAFHWIYFHACMRREQEEDWIKRNETNELTPE